MTVPSLARSILGGEVSQHTPLLAVSKEDANLIMQITGCHDLYRERGRGMPSDHCCHLPVRRRVIGVYVWQSQRTRSHRLRIHSMLAGNQVAWVSLLSFLVTNLIKGKKVTLSSSSFLYFSFTWMMERGTWLYKRGRVKQISPNVKLFFIIIWRNFQFPFHVTFLTFSISFNDFYFSLVHIYLLGIPTSAFPLWFSHLIIQL